MNYSLDREEYPSLRRSGRAQRSRCAEPSLHCGEGLGAGLVAGRGTAPDERQCRVKSRRLWFALTEIAVHSMSFLLLHLHPCGSVVDFGSVSQCSTVPGTVHVGKLLMYMYMLHVLVKVVRRL